jgi:S1-C subfamily serine protease
MRQYLVLSLAAVAMALCGLTEASAQDRCRVMDPTGTPLNVRTAPNGHMVGTLSNGTLVKILDRPSNVRGRTWVYVGRYEDRVPIGWVYRDYLDCTRNAAMEQFRRLPGQAFKWTGQDTLTVANADECERRCASDGSCVAFTFFRTPKQCRPMQSVSDLLNGQDAESGIRLSMQEPKRSGESVAPKTVPPSTVPPSSERPPQQQQPSAPTLVSSGSRFFVSTEGHLVTNAHVVAGCTYVRSSRGGQINRVSIDEASDLALYIASEKVPFAALLRGGRGPRVGEPVIAIGFPLKGLLSSDAIITTGAISALAGLKNDRRKIQITAPVQPGNSGGPLLGENGSVVGVVVGKLDALKMAEVIGDIPQNVNFAVSLGTLQSFLNANGVPYLLDDGTATKTSADVAADASRYTVLLECFRSAPR